MPLRLVNFLANWRGLSNNSQVVIIWEMVPICLYWCIWRERNDRNFEDGERSIEELEVFFLKFLFLQAEAIICNELNVYDLFISIVSTN